MSVVATVFFGASCLVSACSETTKYRVLSFFLDGVPKPETRVAVLETSPGLPGPEGIQAEASPRRPDRVKLYPHPPYRDSRCGSCHDPEDGQPFKTAEQGLCLSCHGEVKSEARYVHGPVNVNACLFCHHHHASPYPKVLVDHVRDLCLRCHAPQDLTVGPHHQTIERQSCVDCHHPHGGSNRFFLKRAQP